MIFTKYKEQLRDYFIPVVLVALYLAILFYIFIFKTKGYQGVEYRLWDFRAYYNAGKAVLENPATLYDDKMLVAGFVNLPIVAYLFAPFALLERQNAEIVFLLLSILSVFAFLHLLITSIAITDWRRTLVIILVFTHHPLFNSLRFGNTTQFVLLLLTCCFFNFRKGRDFKAGFLLALVALIKIPLAFLSLFFILKQRSRIVFSFFATLLSFITASLLIFGIDLNVAWFNKCILTFAGKTMSAYNIQSVSGFLARLSSNIPIDVPEAWNPIRLSGELRLVQYVISACLIGILIWVIYRSRHSTNVNTENLEFFTFLVLALLISPLSWTHYYLLLLLPISLWIAGKLPILPGRISRFFMLLCILLVGTPPLTNVPRLLGLSLAENSSFGNFQFPVTFMADLIVSPNFLGGIVLFGILLVSRYRRMA